MQPRDPEPSKWRDHFEKAGTIRVSLSGDGDENDHDHDHDDVDGDASEMRGILSVNGRLSLMTRI